MMTGAVESEHYKQAVNILIWRHGDRSPTKTFRTDPFQEGNWTFGGGGFGQLSPVGMSQQMRLGEAIRKTYVDNLMFLGPRYSSKEIYVRSTDKNRTVISALSNILGMYGQKDNNAVADSDFPPDEGWPSGFVPVAIHTVDDDTDYVGNAAAVCDRQTYLWEMAKTSAELQAFQNRPDVVTLLANLTQLCGEPIDIDNLWVVRDALSIEQIHANNTLRKVNPWFTDDLFDQMSAVNDQMKIFQNGIFNGTLTMNSLDIGKEIQKIRGGSMINDINMHMNIKLQCMNKSESNCTWINGLKYYAYSAHDTTIYAFFSILGIGMKVIASHGHPDYAAATFIELWRNRTDNRPYFKLTYHQNDGNVTLYPITHLIDYCKGQLYCSVDIFQAFADGAKPDQPMDEIWRHGDRSPTKTFPTDPFQEGNWTFGGGGFGQLSPIGMKQHMKLGKLIRKTYVDDLKFLSPRYSSRE
ncbi:histidine acid phosphatase, partial [Teladorsagia circumcincta]